KAAADAGAAGWPIGGAKGRADGIAGATSGDSVQRSAIAHQSARRKLGRATYDVHPVESNGGVLAVPTIQPSGVGHRAQARTGDRLIWRRRRLFGLLFVCEDGLNHAAKGDVWQLLAA